MMMMIKVHKNSPRLLCLAVVALGLLIGRIFMNKWKDWEQQRLADENKKREYAATRRSRRQRVRDTDLREDQICVVCRSNPREIILLPCGHVCLCEDCSDDINSDCPVCRAPIVQKNVAYIS